MMSHNRCHSRPNNAAIYVAAAANRRHRAEAEAKSHQSQQTHHHSHYNNQSSTMFKATKPAKQEAAPAAVISDADIEKDMQPTDLNAKKPGHKSGCVIA